MGVNQPVLSEPAGSSGSPDRPLVWTVQSQFNRKTSFYGKSDRFWLQSTVRPTGPVRFLNHELFILEVDPTTRLGYDFINFLGLNFMGYFVKNKNIWFLSTTQS